MGALSVSASKIGAFCLIIATSLAILRKKMSKTLAHNVGGSKRLNALSTSIGAIILTPFALYSWFDATLLSTGQWFHFMEALLFCVAVFMAVNYYIDTLVKPQLRSQQAMQSSIITSVLVCFIIELWYDENSFSFYTMTAFALICFGSYYFLQNLITYDVSSGN